jgi:V/A-type H+-transporting ATPase subunit I
MLRPAAMKRVLILVPRRDVEAVVEAVGRLGVLHLLDLSAPDEGMATAPAAEVEERRRTCEAQLRQIEALARFYAPPPQDGAAPLPAPASLGAQLAEWTRRMEELRRERSELQAQIDELARSLHAVSSLAPGGVEPGRLSELRLLHSAFGWIEARDLERLREALARVPHRSLVVDGHGSQRLILAFCLVHDRATLDRALRATGFVPVALPSRLSGTEPEAAQALAALRAEAQQRLATLEERFAAERQALGGPLSRARAATERELLRCEARGRMSRSESVTFIAGWVPERSVAELASAVQRATGGRSYLRADPPQSIDTVRSGAERVPILFRNPALVRPFERVVSSYGVPSWRELDPTPLVAVALWTMFGLMFGDLGQGLVLAAVGWWILRRLARYRDYGVILMECGLASGVFGLAYGSVFGYEGLLPALWFRPMQDVPRLLRVGAGFGFLFLGLGLALGLANAALRRDWRSLVLGSHGLLAAMAYWSAAALALRWLATGSAAAEVGSAALLVAAPLALLFVGRAGAAVRERTNPLAALIQSAVELVDVVVRNVANTVSFVRLAAFAVSHAALLLAVFGLAETVSASRFGTLSGALVIVFGNLVILALEGLIVSIQAVRLVYYEFFSRFHTGAGLEYRPLRLRALAREEVS